jgi:hypothetical protein
MRGAEVYFLDARCSMASCQATSTSIRGLGMSSGNDDYPSGCEGIAFRATPLPHANAVNMLDSKGSLKTGWSSELWPP